MTLRQPSALWLKLLSVLAIIVIVAIATRIDPPRTDPDSGTDIDLGIVAYNLCAHCHTLQLGDHRTGPSLAAIWGRKAGTVDGFRRYSKALQKSDLVWDEATLDAWLRDPSVLVPGNRMIFQGLEDVNTRTGLITLLKSVSEEGPDSEIAKLAASKETRTPDLKNLKATAPVKQIKYCGDTYDVSTVTGMTRQYWEYNLRFKTDGSERGPEKGSPIFVPSGTVGDRAYIVFATPEEIGAAITHVCR